MIDSQSLAENAPAVIAAGFALLVLAWFWEEAANWYRWRFGKPVIGIELRGAALPKLLQAGDRFEHHRFADFGAGFQLTAGTMDWADTDRDLQHDPRGEGRAQRLSVKNYSEQPLSKVVLTLHVKAREMLKTESGSVAGGEIFNGPAHIVLGALAPYASDEFVCFVSNDTPHLVGFEFVGAEAKLVGGAMRKVEFDFLNSPFPVLYPSERFTNA